MTSAASKLLMLGLRGSGKTTYLAALWHHLESAEVEDQLELPHLQPYRDYLNSIRNNWLSLKLVGRTSLRTKTTVSMSLNDRKTKSGIEISIPDLSGESFRLQWSTRKVPTTYASYARECTGAFLFIHPHEIRRTYAIKAAEENNDWDGNRDGPRIAPSKNWTPEQSSTQVQLVDIVQTLLRLREITDPMRIAVIISAWDLIKAPISPLGWLDGRLPLLSQFLRANENYFASEVFGVSAQGGDLVADRDKLLKNDLPSTRCQTLQGDNNIDTVSITAPLRFLLDTRR